MPSQWPPADVERANETVCRLTLRWGLTKLELIPEAYCSLVYFAECSAHGRCVLKVPVIGEERTSGYRASVAFDGHGGAPILDSEPETGSVLLKRLNRARELRALPELQAIQVVVDMMQRLQQAPSFEAMRLEDWHTEPRPDAFPIELWDRAKGLIRELLQTTTERRFLHGDLHHENILPDETGEYFAIDPKGVWGDPAFECVAFLRNPIASLPSALNLSELLAERIEFFSSALSLNPYRVWAWAYADITLSSASSPGPFTSCCMAVSDALWEIRGRFTQRR